MELALLQEKNALQLNVGEDLRKHILSVIEELLDHATFRKEDVKYDGSGSLEMLLRRNMFEKKRRHFLWFRVWVSARDPSCVCLLKVNDVVSCQVRDDDPTIPQKQEVTIGDIVFDDREIHINSFCGRDNDYAITLHVKRINVILRDLERVSGSEAAGSSRGEGTS